MVAITQKDYEFIENALDEDKYLPLFQYIYTQQKSEFTEQELYSKIPSGVDKELLLANLCRCNLLKEHGVNYTKEGTYVYKRLNLTAKFKQNITELDISPTLKNYFITAISNQYV